MNTQLALTQVGNQLTFAPYNGSASQSFRVTTHNDGRVSIRCSYQDLALTANDENITLEPYTGDFRQLLRFDFNANGPARIEYNSTVLTDFNNKVYLSFPNLLKNNQKFWLIEQADGSTGIRKVERSVFWGTPDPGVSIIRVGNHFTKTSRQATGFYAHKKIAFMINITIRTISGPITPKLWVGAHFANPDVAYSIPRSYTLTEGINTITDTGGGPIYLELIGEQNSAHLIFQSGVAQIPYWEHHKTSPDNYRNMLTQWSLSPIVELYSERALVTVSRAAALAHTNNNGDLDELMQVYEKIISIGEDLIGLDGSIPLHTRAALKYHLVLGNYGGAGDAHALHGYTAYLDSFAQEMLTPEHLKQSWGIAHELGHQNQMLGYMAPEFVEVTNNVFALAVQREFNLPSLLLGQNAEGLDTWARLLKKLYTPQAKIEHLDFYERLAVLEQLRLAFGNDFWKNMNKITREQWSSNGYFPDRLTAFNNFALFACMAAKTNLLDYLDAWGFPITASVIIQIDRLNLPSPTAPIQTLRENASSDHKHIFEEVLIDCNLHPELRST